MTLPGKRKLPGGLSANAPAHSVTRRGRRARTVRSDKQKIRVVLPAQSRIPRMWILRGAQQGMMYPGSVVVSNHFP